MVQRVFRPSVEGNMGKGRPQKRGIDEVWELLMRKWLIGMEGL